MQRSGSWLDGAGQWPRRLLITQASLGSCPVPPHNLNMSVSSSSSSSLHLHSILATALTIVDSLHWYERVYLTIKISDLHIFGRTGYKHCEGFCSFKNLLLLGAHELPAYSFCFRDWITVKVLFYDKAQWLYILWQFHSDEAHFWDLTMPCSDSKFPFLRLHFCLLSCWYRNSSKK